MAIRINGAVSTALTQKRLVMSTSSEFSSPSSGAVIVRGSSAIPQMGQLPGASRTISGCIGHVYSGSPGAPTRYLHQPIIPPAPDDPPIPIILPPPKTRKTRSTMITVPMTTRTVLFFFTG